ncbi:hypothetical protein C922_05172 [Plasmodium inui San Antonio 1]|uniref:Uncharacterized protein n=1 Tax=Plasmodium inui San Antonio 1 TaxID=1237626 RepID=W6ZYM9_9APIC|nr:hypothetical protein C922_05172 [Plasmodium inui San Antonio 1]EUD64458.1 hypothetical protein C922_05172 [Plasmodium inui San Antonio 1]
MAHLRLRGERGYWAVAAPPSSGRECIQGEDRYCLGAYGGGEQAERGFLGLWASGLRSMIAQNEWSDIINGRHPIVKSIWGNRGDQFEWKGALTCVMLEALKLQQIPASQEGTTHVLWRQSAWHSLLREGTASDWSSSETGRRMLVAVLCLMRILMGSSIAEGEPDAGSKQLCQRVWDMVTLRMNKHKGISSSNKIETLDEYLDNLSLLPGETLAERTSLGFLLSIFHGLSECCQYERNYDLTSLIVTNGWDLSPMGSCTMEGGQFSCSGGTGETPKAQLNIWTTGKHVLVKESDAAQPRSLELLDTHTGKALSHSPTSPGDGTGMDTRMFNWIQEKQTSPTNQSIVIFKNGRPVQQPPKPQPTSQKKAEQEETLKGGTAEYGGRSGSSVKEIQRTDDAEARRGEVGTLATGIESPPPVRRERVEDHRGQGITEPKMKKQAPPDDVSLHPNSTPNHSTLPRAEEGQVSENLGIGGIIGGVVSMIMGMATVYGMYRVYFRKEKGSKRSKTKHTSFSGKLKYMKGSVNPGD